MNSSCKTVQEKILLDTNIISEVRRPLPDSRVVRKLRRLRSDQSYLSSVTIGELAYGVARLSAGRRRDDLRLWLDELKKTYASHILPLDVDTAEAWGQLAAECDAKGKRLPVRDAQIAATALRHGLVLMTRNTSDFIATGVPLINPWLDDPTS